MAKHAWRPGIIFFSAATAAAIAALALVGRALDVSWMLRFAPSGPSMHPLTAGLFLCLCALLGLVEWGRARGRQTPWVKAIAGFVFVIVLVKLEGYVDWGFEIDQFFFFGAPGIHNRMALGTAYNFLLLSASVFFSFSSFPGRHWVAQGFSVAALGNAALALVGHVYRVVNLMENSFFVSMAVNTAAAFICLSVGFLLLFPREGFVAQLSSLHAGGIMARRIIPMAALSLFFLGGLWLTGERLGYYDGAFTIALTVISQMLLLSVLVWWTARIMNGLDLVLRERVMELEGANRELDNFAHSVAHDLRTPLNSVGGFSRELEQSHAQSLDEEGKDYLRRIGLAAHRMESLITGLLDLARIRKQELHRERLDLTAMARLILSDLKSAEPGRHVIYNVADGLWARGDQRLVEALLLNLLGNAWKFSAKKSGAQIEVGHLLDKNAFFVRDNGAGFDMSQVGRLFQTFERLHRDTEFAGTGIGLTTSHKIVQRHGGKIWAEAVPGAGATFFFTLEG